MAGKIDSWDIIWTYSHFKHDAVALLPVVSKVYNIGFDKSGTHCRRSPFKQAPLTSETCSDYRFPEFIHLDPYFVCRNRTPAPSLIASQVGAPYL